MTTVKNKILKSLNIIKKYGLKVLLLKIWNITTDRTKKLTNYIFIMFYLMLNKNNILNNLRQFVSTDPEETFNFISKNFFTVFEPMQIKEEFLVLLEVFKKTNPKTIMEIGTANGGTLFCFSKLAPNDAMIISIDLPGGEFGGGYPTWKVPFYRAFAKKGQAFYLLRENSHTTETLDKVKKILANRQIDFLFIDGDHSYKGVKKDFEMYSPLVRNGGIIAFHDIVKHPLETGCEVDKLWAEIKNNFNFKELVKNINQNWAGIGIVYK